MHALDYKGQCGIYRPFLTVTDDFERPRTVHFVSEMVEFKNGIPLERNKKAV